MLNYLQYTLNFKRGNDKIAQKVLYLGNNNKSLHISIEASLKKLRTSYIDLLYVHCWDFDTSFEEVMRSLHTLIVARKVLYLVSPKPIHKPGILLILNTRVFRTLLLGWLPKPTNTPEIMGWPPLSSTKVLGMWWTATLRGRSSLWHALKVTTPLFLTPYATFLTQYLFIGMALAPWNVLAGGKLRTDAEEERRRKTGEYRTLVPNWERTEKERKVAAALEKVAGEVGAKHITSGKCVPTPLNCTTHDRYPLQWPSPTSYIRPHTCSPSLVDVKWNNSLPTSKH